MSEKSLNTQQLTFCMLHICCKVHVEISENAVSGKLNDASVENTIPIFRIENNHVLITDTGMLKIQTA